MSFWRMAFRPRWAEARSCSGRARAAGGAVALVMSSWRPDACDAARSFPCGRSWCDWSEPFPGCGQGPALLLSLQLAQETKPQRGQCCPGPCWGHLTLPSQRGAGRRSQPSRDRAHTRQAP